MHLDEYSPFILDPNLRTEIKAEMICRVLKSKHFMPPLPVKIRSL